jgi:hypothetical protein
VGHPNYQHPQRLRKGGYSAEIDRFSHLAIYTALRCLMVGGKTLWAAHDNAENVLFREVDFHAPARSKLFPKLLALPDAGAAALAGHLLLASQGPLDRVPLVSDLVSEGSVLPLSAEQLDRLCALGPPIAAVLAPGLEPAAEWFHTAAPTVEAPTMAESPTVAEMPSAEQPSAPEPMSIPFEQRRAAAELFNHANQVLTRNADAAYAQQLLLSSCKLDPTNLEYRKLLREVGRTASRQKKSGLFGSLGNLPARSRMRAARSAGNHRKVLEHGEELLARQPGDVPAQLEMAEAAEALNLPALAVWLLKEAHHQAPTNLTILRTFAHLCERLERYAAAAAIWYQIHQAIPTDAEAAAKVKTLSAWDAVARTTTLV